MEPITYPGDDPGPGALMVGLDPPALRQRLAAALAQVPGAKGVNNHMGSAFTADQEGMTAALLFIKEEGLYFVDSRTCEASVGLSLARRLGLPALGRDVFLDHTAQEQAIRRQLAALARIADRNGMALGIGHPYPETVSALTQALPEMAEEGRHFATVSEVLP
jgi:polysaccharide deacetylase 2 family uncharacterized protein YibQ